MKGNGRMGAGCAGLALALAGCAGTSPAATQAGSGTAAAEDGSVAIVATTSVLGDVVGRVVGDAASVETLMPPGSDPHSFEPSAQQLEALQDADLVVANGAGFEESLVGILETAESDGVPVFHATDHVELIAFEGDHGHEEEGEEHAEEAGSDDPHFFQDPSRMAEVVRALGADLAEASDALTPEEWTERADAYAAELDGLDRDIAEQMADIPADGRRLVTNHDAFGYFADRYDFEVVGTVIPGGTTLEDPSAADLEELAAAIQEEGVPAIFAENTATAALAEALSNEAGADVEVVELFSDSLGDEDSDGATYVDMLRTNAGRVADALG